ncbi:MAG: HmuY family protein [Spirochaetaceae bacterium]|jgi:hypothetical protein|nr:HmuY family protein [Spirochaetaceae bacterium]
MKQSKVFLGFLVLFCAAAIFLGCDNNPNDDLELGSGSFGLAVQAGQTFYYSLSTGEQVENPASKDWDIAFTRTRLILTNSGASATTAGSSGQGGVWYSGMTDFGAVTIADKGADNAALSTDTALYIWTGMGAAPTATTTLNVMSYVGYGYGSGTTNSFGSWESKNVMAGETQDWTGYPANGPLTDYRYDANHYYQSAGMGVYVNKDPKPVYIIRHGDGTHYSKIQIDYEYLTAATSPNGVIEDSFFVTYENLN